MCRYIICFPDNHQLLLKSRKIHLLPSLCYYTAITWTGVLLIYIITNVPIPLYQVNYAPYLILILLWEPGSVSASPAGNHQVSIRSSPLVSASLESVCLRHHTVSRPFQQTTATSLLSTFLSDPRRYWNAVATCCSELVWDKLIEYVSAEGGLKTFIIQLEKTPIWPHQMLTYEMKRNFNSVDLIVLSCLKSWKHVLQSRLIQSYSLKSKVKIVLKM